MKEKLNEITWDQKQNTYKDLQIFSRKTAKSFFDLGDDQKIHLLHELVIYHQKWACCHKGWIRNWVWLRHFWSQPCFNPSQYWEGLLRFCRRNVGSEDNSHDGNVIPGQHVSFSCDFNTLITSSELMCSHSKIFGSIWSSEVSESRSQSPLKCVSSAFNSSVTFYVPTAFKNNWSAWVSSLNVVCSDLSLMALTIESRAS